MQEKVPKGILFICIASYVPVVLLGTSLIQHQIFAFSVLSAVAMALLPIVLGFGLLKFIPIIRKIIIILSAIFAMGLMLDFYIFYDKSKSSLSLPEYSQINWSEILLIIFLIWVVIYLNHPEVKRHFIHADKPRHG